MPRARPPLAALAAAVLALVPAACGGSGGSRAVGPATARARPATPEAPALCRSPLRVRRLGTVRDPAMDELSGLALGRAHPQVLYAHEDSGAPPVLTMLARGDARVLGHVTVTGAREVDWEDIAARRSPARGPELFIGDIGDNLAERSAIQVYRVPEPAPGAGATPPAVRLDLRYPDGAHDAEALLADPLRDELVIVTKGLFSGRAYGVRTGVAGLRPATLRRGPVLPDGLVTAGDVSTDGRTVALRTYGRLLVWRRHGRESLLRTLSRRPCTARADLGAEGQGEALALTADGRAALTAPEGARPVLRRYAPRTG